MNWTKAIVRIFLWSNFFGLAWLLLDNVLPPTTLNVSILAVFFLIAAFSNVKAKRGRDSDGQTTQAR